MESMGILLNLLVMSTAIKRASQHSVGMNGGTTKACVEDRILLSTVITSVPHFSWLSRSIALQTTLFFRVVSVEKLTPLDSGP